MALLISGKGFQFSKTSILKSNFTGVKHTNKRTFDTLIERSFKYRELSASALDTTLKANPDEKRIWHLVTRHIENPPAVINGQAIKDLVTAPKRLFSVLESYMKLTQTTGMPLWYELKIDPTKTDGLLSYKELHLRAGLHIGDAGDSASLAERIWGGAYKKDKKGALKFSAEAKSILLQYLKDPKGLKPLFNPLTSSAKKMETMGKYFKKTPNDKLFSVNMQILLLSLVSKDKLAYLPYALRNVFLLGFAAQGGILGSITTTSLLPARARVDVTETAKKALLTPTDNLVLQFKENPTMSGGYVLAIPTKGMIDKSWAKVIAKVPEVKKRAIEHVIRKQYGGL